MNGTTVRQEFSVSFQEIGAGEALAGIFHLRVAEGQPNLLHFTRSEEPFNDFDIGTQKGNIFQTFLDRLCGSCPHAGSLDIDTDEIDVWK